MKFVKKGAILEQTFTTEVQEVKEQYEHTRHQLDVKDRLIYRMGVLMARQEQQNITLRTEQLMNNHPRWRLIPTIEYISVVDLSKLVTHIQRHFYPALFAARPLEDEDKLEQIYDEKSAGTNRYRSLFTNPNQSPLSMLLRGPQQAAAGNTVVMDKQQRQHAIMKLKTQYMDKKNAYEDIGGEDSDLVGAWEEDGRQMLELQVEELQDKVTDFESEIEYLKDKLRIRKLKKRELKEKLTNITQEFDTLKTIYAHHLHQFEQAVQIRSELEARIRLLEKMESDKMVLIKAEYGRREQQYLDIVRLLQDDSEKFKQDIVKEFEVKDAILSRKDQNIEILKKELIYAQNVIKNPTIYQKAAEYMGADLMESYRYDRLGPLDRQKPQHPQETSNMRHVCVVPTEVLIKGARRSVPVAPSNKFTTASVFSPKNIGASVFTPNNPVSPFSNDESFTELISKRLNVTTANPKQYKEVSTPIATFMKPFLQLPMQKLADQYSTRFKRGTATNRTNVFNNTGRTATTSNKTSPRGGNLIGYSARENTKQAIMEGGTITGFSINEDQIIGGTMEEETSFNMKHD
ncbi:hypothetical protein FGO68_gene13128 [Halteria grandinella]|uniref:Uncharacterized protein n=1 Tax=Halteria grandinella TaxID=5974 RepID=A0A8J8SWI3_HALGN|nr:hypothetical protein FGO68_gene13128 [Halteria grandinella]